MNKGDKIYISGHRGLIGSAITRNLVSKGYRSFVLRTHDELDLTDQRKVNEFFDKERPEYVFLCAAMVGGIWANDTRPAEFVYSNLMVQCNVIHAADEFGVRKLLFMGSSCIYPKYSPQPIAEEQLMSGPLEPTNEAYAIAKISGLMMCRAFNKQFGDNMISVMPTNSYGPNDKYGPDRAHVLPALIRKFHEAKVKGYEDVALWGTGYALREFLYSDDLAEACVMLMEKYDSPDIINIGSGEETSIRDLAFLVAEVIGYSGIIDFDARMPDGTPRKLLDSSKINALGWRPKIRLKEGIALAYEDFKERNCK